MNEYLQSVNAGYFYLLVAGVMAFITAVCVIFLVKSYRAGIKIGMDKKVRNSGKTHRKTYLKLCFYILNLK